MNTLSLSCFIKSIFLIIVLNEYIFQIQGGLIHHKTIPECQQTLGLRQCEINTFQLSESLGFHYFDGLFY